LDKEGHLEGKIIFRLKIWGLLGGGALEGNIQWIKRELKYGEYIWHIY
jgi:hypothetical protein